MSSVVGVITSIASLLAVVAVYLKMRPEVESIGTRTETERYSLEERRRTEQREAEQRLADTVNDMLTNVTSSYQGLLETVNRAHDKVVDGMKVELKDVRDRLIHVEDMLMQERTTTGVLNEAITGLNRTVEGLNAAVTERDATIRRIRETLNSRQGIDADTVVSPDVAPERRTH